ncbi:MAG: hypothetical protein HQL88_02250 [Magnetococcales bacterium]|nr:hypothetical protein [Magnetococcales bacterium]
MADNSQNITLSSCSDPGSSSVGYVEGLSIQLSVPYSESEVTVKINACDDEQQAGSVKETKSTKTLKFDFGKSNVKKVKVSHNAYVVKLESINKVQDDYSFGFLVEW